MAIPVISVKQMREWEQATWASGQTETEVIAHVGKIVAERALHLTQPGEKILILAGKGHNGDDARAALPHLLAREALLLNVIDPQMALEKIRAACRNDQKPKLILDGLFGIGLSRTLQADWQNLIKLVNDLKIPVLAIDVPSGLDADTGEVRGAAIRATNTLTLGAPKRGLLKNNAVAFVGRLEVAGEIGLTKFSLASELNWSARDDYSKFPPAREISSHKGTFGHLVIVAGSPGYHGAAVLATNGALRAQPGLVTLFTPENVYVPVASQLRAAMVNPWHNAREIPKTCSAILFGPGLAAKELSANLRNELVRLWQESPLPVLVDASALDWIPPGGDFSNRLRVITPHPGEAARLLGVTSDEVQTDRVVAMRKLSSRFGNCFVVLKGHQTLIGRSAGDILINSTGNPFLAQGGSGDVLAGFLSGLLAQGNLRSDLLKTMGYAVWQHGATADELCVTQPNWTIDDLLVAIGSAVRKQNS
ncbi:MAG: NAD(P)H-hydrate dehydratase [Verrucomicrobiota bacterium]